MDKAKDKNFLFHVANGGKLYFAGKIRSILDFARNSDDCFDTDDYIVTDCDGNVIMDRDEYLSAVDDGIGRLDIDGEYNTWYTVPAHELSPEEVAALVDSI